MISGLVVPVTLTLMVLVLWPVITDVWSRFVHDHRDPLVFHDVRVLTTSVPAGGELRYTSQYSKRADCHPPQGRGDVSYKMVRVDQTGTAAHTGMTYTFSFTREAKWPPGDHLSTTSHVPIPDDIPPGRYIYSATAVYTCKGAARALLVTGPTFPVTVLPGIPGRAL